MVPKVNAYDHLNLPAKGEYDLQSEEGKQILEMLDRERVKAEEKLKHNSKMPKLSAVFEAEETKDLEDWNLDIIEMNDFELIVLARDIFTKMDLFEKYQIPQQIFLNFMWEAHYYYTRNNPPYHNFNHAILVFHGCFILLKRSTKLSALLAHDEQFAFLVSALGHDLDHRGRNNHFEINSSSELAIRYHDVSPLEQHHAAILFTILTKHESNLMRMVDATRSKGLRQMMITNIKNTDMVKHFDMLVKFRKCMVNDAKFGSLDRKFRDMKSLSSIFLFSFILQNFQIFQIFNFFIEPEEKLKEDKQLISSMFLHVSDIGASARSFNVADKWNRKVVKEFSDQVKQIPT